VQENTAQAIGEATQTLLQEITDRNHLTASEVVSVFFSVTKDLTALFPAKAARDLGWSAPMLDLREMDVPDALARCIRVLIHVNGDRQAQHVYLSGARVLRPDLEETI